MRCLVVLCFLVAIAQKVRCDNPLGINLKTVKNFSQKIQNEARNVESTLGPSVARFEEALKNGFRSRHEGVKGVYNRALAHLNTVPEECIEGVRDSILNLQSSADKTFLSCSNLTVAVEDLGNLVTFTGKMLLGLARSVQELTWFTNCFSWNPIKSLPCFFEWIGLIFQGTRGLFGSLSRFNTELDNTLLNMLKIVEYCQARTMEEHDIVALMSPVHQCAEEPIPHHLYTIHNY